MTKHTLTLYYSVNNGGDGSAYPHFFESQALAQLDQDWESEYGEGWGESCDGSITLESDSPISVIGKEINTLQSLKEEIENDFQRGWMKEKEYTAKMKDLLEIAEGTYKQRN